MVETVNSTPLSLFKVDRESCQGPFCSAHIFRVNACLVLFRSLVCRLELQDYE